MNALTQKIAKQSKVVLIMAEVARIILYVTLGMTIAAFVCSFLDADVPVFVLFGKPIYAIDLSDGLSPAQARVEYVKSAMEIGLTLVLLFMVSALFKRIASSQTPFTADIVKRIKAVGIMLGVVITLDSGYLGVVLAFVVYALAMIFEYGGELQHQVDETL